MAGKVEKKNLKEYENEILLALVIGQAALSLELPRSHGLITL